MKTLHGIIFYIILLSSSVSIAATVTTLSLHEKDSVTTSNYPLTFGHAFKDGDVSQYVQVRYNGMLLTTQCDVKTTYPSGKVKFAIISTILPSIVANSTNIIVLETASSTTSTGYIDKAAILATNIEDEVRLTNISGSGYTGSLTADLNAQITADSSLSYWLRGSVATEILVQQGLNNSLESSWEVRYYPGTSFGPRVSHSIENMNADYRGIVNYDVDIQAGLPTLSSRYSKSSVQHNENSRWRKVFWVGSEPPETELHYDLAYLSSTGTLMNYDTSISVPESTMATKYSEWLLTDHDIMGNGSLKKYFPEVGGRDDIGVLPAWTARYLLSMDNRMREIMISNGEMAAHCPIHYRETNPAKSAYRNPISIDDRVTVWTQDNSEARASTYGDTADRLPTAIGNYGTAYHGWTIDVAHQGSFAYVPYLITGDNYFLREMQYWASYNLSACDYNYDYGRQGNKGIINPGPRETRGVAWALRNIGDAAAFSLDSDMEKTYLSGKIENNFDFWYSTLRLNYPLHHISSINNHDTFSTDVTYVTSPWMDDFCLLSLSHLHDLGFTNAKDKAITWFSEFIIGRFTDPDFNHYNATPYRFPAKIADGSKVQSWAQASALFLTQPTSFPTVTTGTSLDDYRFVALAALSVVDRYVTGGKGTTSMDWLLGQIQNSAFDALNADNPKWVIIPRISTQKKRYRLGTTPIIQSDD